MVSLKTLNTLCNKLKVTPALLFEYAPDRERETSRSTKGRRSR
jgi:DNA-binding Xre family transcriptional regulator